MSIIRPKNAYPNVKYFESIEILNQFDIIRKNLVKKNFHIDPNYLTKENIAEIIIQLVHLQEDLLGQQSNKQITRIPMKCFLDFHETGALYLIILGCFQYNNWKNLNLTIYSRHEIIKLFEYLQKLLIEQHILTFPRCYLHSNIDKNLQIQLKTIIEKHHGTVVEYEQDAGHIIYPLLNENQRNIQIEREIEKREHNYRLHYWFYPDSFDIWLSNIDDEESDKRHETFPRIWHITANWILDTDLFNEWMNEEDYQIDKNLVGSFLVFRYPFEK
ncbi:unnamed protein product [Rotaria sp. Silwood2]|nr:unnamed protein product [Rotaria sp. Silwood2]CAF3358741.1 unnamed protein product [Rotaria sp. Silwood2]